jgi:hypothetical protein
MIRLQSTGVFGLIASPIMPASGDDHSYGTRAGLLGEDDPGPSVDVATRAKRLVAAASIVCCIILGAALAIPGVATLVHAQSFCAFPAP